MSEWIVLGFLLLVVMGVAGGVAAIVRSSRQQPSVGQASPPYVPHSIPAGWYDDGSGTIRWYDGQRWTPHTR